MAAGSRSDLEPREFAANPRDMRFRLVALIVAIAFVAGALFVISSRASNRSSTASVSGSLRVGGAAPDFSATDLTGRRVSLSALRGHPVILAFGASWCHPCTEEYPLLVRAKATYSGRLEIVSVMYEDVKADELQFLHQFGVTWSAIDDSSDVISSAYQVHELPQTFFVTPKGVLQTRAWGLTTQGALDDPLRRLLASR